MSAKKTEPDDATEPPLIIFDPADGEMHAGTFDKASAKVARKLARRYKCHVAAGDAAALNDLAARIILGRIEDGRLLLASVPADVAAELRRLIAPTPDTDDAPLTDETPEEVAAMASDLRDAELDGLGPLSADEVVSLRNPEEAEHTSGGSQSGHGAGAASADASGADAGGSTQGGSGDPANDKATENRKSDPWDALSVGDLVLAADLDKKGDPECWFEAVIVRITPVT